MPAPVRRIRNVELLYLSLSYVPSRRASSVQVMRMCEAFAEAGHRVTLVAKRAAEDGVDPFAFYGVARTFALELIARPARRGGGLVYAGGVSLEVARRRRSTDVVYCRDLVGAIVALELGARVAFEAHGVQDRRWQRALWRRMVRHRNFLGLVAISNAMVAELGKVDLLPVDRPIVVAHSPANRNAGAAPKATVATPPRIGYVGSLYPGRGIDRILEVAAAMPDCRFELVGGTDADLAHWRERTGPNVTLRGFVAPAELAVLYREFDVLLMPYPHEHVQGPSRRLDTARYCSPMKMFEYMAAGVPIVASDLPVLGEVLVHERNALIAPYGDAASWRAAIARLLDDRDLRIRLAQRALDDVGAFTPQARVAAIVRGLDLAE